jgi:flagellar hook-basal body protein
MSFYTSLTGLNAASSQLTVTSNNIANVGTTGFKRSRADFGDIFATSPLQKAASVIGQGVSLKAVTQEFSQGNIQFSANSLDIAITGDGFFPLKSVDGLQDIYTRNGSFALDDSFNVVNSQGQALMAAAVDSSGKADLSNLAKLQLSRKTSGDARETTAVELGLNFPADADVISKAFSRDDPTSYSKTTTVTVYDSGGNGYLATVYYVKTQVATPSDPYNKWQTHVYIGDTKLQENLIQGEKEGSRLFVNKYGEVRPESGIPPEELSRGINKLYKLDDLKNAQPSVAASVSSDPLPTSINNIWRGGFDLATLVPEAGATTTVGTIAANPKLVFDLKVDGSAVQTIDLSDLLVAAKKGTSYTGVDMARLVTDRINRQFGDEKYFNFDGELFEGATAGTKDTVMTLVLSDSATSTGAKTLHLKLTGTDWETGLTGQITPENLVSKLQTQINASTDYLPAGTTTPKVKVSWDPVEKRIKFDTSGLSATQTLTLKGGGDSKGLLGLNKTGINAAEYKEEVLPNGKFKVPVADQRFGIQVRYDEDKRTFAVYSGRTGDTSSVSIEIPPATGTGAVANNLINTVFGFVKGETAVSNTPVRGVTSTAAVLEGGIIGLNLANKFRVDESNNQFVVTVDNVTGIITIPPKAEYGAEEFRLALENRINALSDQYGRTVSGVKVNIRGSANKYFTFTSGTTGDNSFVKVTANSIWGLSNVPSARGSTSKWQIPQQARNDAGFPLYVDRNGLETSNPGDFSEAETKDLWAPVFLDNGELTFDSSGKIFSPLEAIQFKSATIGDSGATLKFSISYGASTQYSSPFSVRKQDQNGRPEGDLIGVEIGDDGLVSASYSNGTQKSLAKIVLANFATPTGLRQIGDSSYYASAKSGTAKYGEAGSAGFGTLRAGARERANVDLTQELVDLITAQRNFQASAKAIETNNTLTQAIINLRS